MCSTHKAKAAVHVAGKNHQRNTKYLGGLRWTDDQQQNYYPICYSGSEEYIYFADFFMQALLQREIQLALHKKSHYPPGNHHASHF